MKKLLIAFVFSLLFGSTSYAEVQPRLEVQLSPGNKPTQRVEPATENVEVLRIWFTASNHPANGITIKKLKFKRESADDPDQILRYYLMQGNKTLEKISLPGIDTMEFKNLSLWAPDGKTIELRILTDISTGEFTGKHTFTIAHPDNVTVKKSDIRDADTWVFGRFPITGNKILIGAKDTTPSPDCNLREEPVCGEDGKSYYNLCIPFQKGIKIKHEGACQIRKTGTEKCHENYEPVCGSDGKTYTNLCFLEEKGLFPDYMGECFPKSYNPPRTFKYAKELFDLKKNQLLQVRPRISNYAQEKLNSIEHILDNYNFAFDPKKDLLPKISSFLQFTQNPSDRSILEKEIDALGMATGVARSQSAREKFKLGGIPFLDVDEQEWFYGPVKFLKEKGWASGYLDELGNQTGLYRPDNHVTKAEITKLAFEASNILWKNQTENPTNRLAHDHWAAQIVALAEENGLNMWRWWPNPDKKATRGEVLRLIFEVYGVEPPKTFPTSSFSDVSKYSKNFRYIEHAKQIGLISGYPDGTFREKNPILRAEAAKIIQNAFQMLR